MTDKRREAIRKAQENSPNHKRKKEKEAEKEAKKGQSSLQYQQPIQNQQYYPQPSTAGLANQQAPAQQPVQPQINYLDQQAMTGYPEPEYYQPSPQPVQDYNSLEYLRNTTTVPSYNYQQRIPQLTRLNPYSANARENDVISSLGFKMEDSKPKGIAKPRPNTSAGRPGGMRQEPVQEQPQVNPLDFFK
jgi:hypothetical protein